MIFSNTALRMKRIISTSWNVWELADMVFIVILKNTEYRIKNIGGLKTRKDNEALAIDSMPICYIKFFYIKFE